MIIQRKRIRAMHKYLSGINIGAKFFLGISNLKRFDPELKKIGFTDNLNEGDVILPSINFGTISHFNGIGKYLKLKNQPMETAYRQLEWYWKDWGGYDHYKIVDVPYKRYPRKFIKPPSIEFQIRNDSKGDKLLTSSNTLEYSERNFEIILHTINLFLEIFGECQIFYENLTSFSFPQVKKLNWKILPQGRYPWDKLSKSIEPILSNVKKGNYPVVVDRLQKLNSNNPDFRAIGKGGFGEYIIFGFERKGIFVCESIFYGNATYVFDKNWESLSKLSKKEILDNDSQKARIIHRENWNLEIEKLLGNYPRLKLVS